MEGKTSHGCTICVYPRVSTYIHVCIYSLGESQTRDFTRKTVDVDTARRHIPNCCWQKYPVQNYLKLAINIYILHQDEGGSHIAAFSKWMHTAWLQLLPHRTTTTTYVSATA